MELWLKDWWPVLVLIGGWIITATWGWGRMTDKVNGLGARVSSNVTELKSIEGRVDRMEREMGEYRRDAMGAAQLAGRVEKTVEDLRSEIQQGNIIIGAQLSEIQKSIQEKDKHTSNRLVRIETLAKVESKIGPIPED